MEHPFPPLVLGSIGRVACLSLSAKGEICHGSFVFKAEIFGNFSFPMEMGNQLLNFHNLCEYSVMKNKILSEKGQGGGGGVISVTVL